MHVGMDKTDPVELNRTNQTNFSAFGQIISDIWVKPDKNRVKMGNYGSIGIFEPIDVQIEPESYYNYVILLLLLF
jgi:hypothetical protein